MILIEYWPSLAAISCLWVLVRALFCIKDKQFNLKRELQLLLVYVCIVVVARFTFFPFGKVEGKIQPLILDVANMWNFRINWLPFVNLLDYGEKRDVLINVIGNTAMFVPLGIVWAVVYKKLNSHAKVISAGIGFSLMIEILQLPFYDRVTDIDDLILNSLGFIIGYGIYLLAKAVKREKRKGK
ncbi:MAG: VanZ family protein [Oscillospiraceae bacterium]|nr:VanZ family protein [Oscillospiraceae bacterium]